MSKSVLIQTIITLVAILVVGAFGVYALLMSNQIRTSQIVINVIDQNINIDLSGEADWVEDGEADKSFNTETTHNGFIDKVWNMRDLVLTQENINNPANLKIKIINKNLNDVYDLKIQVDGLAYDEYDRFATYVTCSTDNIEVQSQQKITKNDPTFIIIVGGQTQQVDLIFSYLLLQFNSSFDVNQAINITVSTEVKTH